MRLRELDVVLITAAEGEDNGVLAVADGRLGDWEPFEPGDGFPFTCWVARFAAPTSEVGSLSVLLARPLRMGGEHAVNSAGVLVDRFAPRCLAMCGVCAGRPGWTSLGDVIIADKTWRYDEGEVVRTTKEGPEVHCQNVTTYEIGAEWLRAAEDSAKRWSAGAQSGDGAWPGSTDWFSELPLDHEIQGLWLLRELDAGRNPAGSHEANVHCPNWIAVVEQLEVRGFLSDVGATDEGRKHLHQALFKHQNALPRPRPWKVRVGPLGTGNHLRRDAAIWERLGETQRLVHGLDMEASAIGLTAWAQRVECALVVKGVMDFAEPERHRGFRPFAARAAAEVALRFLREQLKPRGGGVQELLDAGTLSDNQKRNNPGTLLSARYEVVEFQEDLRRRALHILEAWCSSPEATSVRLFLGVAGSGKTRLLIEWIRRLRKCGWAAGFLRPPDGTSAPALASADENPSARAQLLAKTSLPTFVVLDYAETRLYESITLLRGFAPRSEGVPLRIALVAREEADWFGELKRSDKGIEHLLTEAMPVVLRAIRIDAQTRVQVFEHAAKCYARRLGKPIPTARPDFGRPEFAVPLVLHVAALAAVEQRPIDPQRLLEDAIDHELRYWEKEVQPERPRGFRCAATRFVTALTLRGRTPRNTLAALDDRVEGPRLEAFRRLVPDLYSSPSSSSDVRGLEPDLLGEVLTWRCLRDQETHGNYLEQVLSGSNDAELRSCLEVLGRISSWLSPTDRENWNDWIQPFLARDLSMRTLPALQAALAIGTSSAHASLGMALTAVLTQTPGAEELASSVEPRLPLRSVSLGELAVWATQTLLASMADDNREIGERARLLNNLGARFSELGRREEALEAVQKGTEIRARLASICSDAFLPVLADSLCNLGTALSDLGRLEDALEATQEATKHFRELAAKSPEGFLPHLALILGNLGSKLSALGRREEALVAEQEATEIRRELASKRPNAFLPDLALSLNNLGIWLSDLGRREEALVATQEASEIRRQLASERPDAFLPDLAMSLINLGLRLSELGRREEGLVATQEATEIWREMASRRREVFLPGLATGLNSLALSLAELGQEEEALEAAQAATEIRRELVSKHPDAFLPALATSLANLGLRLSESGRREEALVVAQEATAIRQELALKRPDAFSPAFAESLSILGSTLSELGRREEALETTQTATDTWRELASKRPDAFLPKLAMSLENQGVRFSDTGRREEAAKAADEATSIYRRLASKYPDRFLPDLASSETNLGGFLLELGRAEEALQLLEEATNTWRELVSNCPEAFLPYLAGSLNNLSATLLELGREEEALQVLEEAVWRYRGLKRRKVTTPNLGLCLNNLSAQLSNAGRREEALQASEEATEILRRLVHECPDRFLSDLAESLNRLAHCLSDLDRREEALGASEEATEILRRLVQERPDVFLPDLAKSLDNLATRLSDLGKRVETLSASEEATEILRRLASRQPAAFSSDLATSLGNLGGGLAELGRQEEALRVLEEATDIQRELARNRSDALRPGLAASLNNLGASLSDLGRQEEALRALEEATAIRRELATERPSAFLPDLAQSLDNLGNTLADLGRWEEALAATQEAKEIRRELARKCPDAFLPDLAQSLNNLGIRLSELGRWEEALEVGQETTRYYRELASKHLDTFLPALAMALNNLGIRLSELGRQEEAVEVKQKATEHYRILASKWPSAYLPDLATSLCNLGNGLSRVGRREEALKAAQEATMIRRELVCKCSDAFLPDLATSLYNLGIRLSKLDRDKEALGVAEESLGLYLPLAHSSPERFAGQFRRTLQNVLGLRESIGHTNVTPTLTAAMQLIAEWEAAAKTRLDR